MKLKEHDIVTLAVDLPDDGLRAAEVGTIVHVHASGKAFVVELADSETLVAQARYVAIRSQTGRRDQEWKRRDATLCDTHNVIGNPVPGMADPIPSIHVGCRGGISDTVLFRGRAGRV